MAGNASGAARKAAIDAYKQRTVHAGVYAVTCVATGGKWVGAASDLRTVKNRIWFSLGTGRSPWREMQRAWQTHGAASFAFQELERIDDDLAAYAREAALKDRLAHWRDTLDASVI